MATFVISEIGVNHNGDFETALKMIDAAKACGADAAKFQAFDADYLGRPELEKLQFSNEQFKDVAAYCKAAGIEFMCTPFDEFAAAYLAPMLKRVKIGSGSLENRELLEAVRQTKLPVIMSTGMSDIGRINNGLTLLGYYSPYNSQQDFTLLHCVSAYPCPVEQANLKAMEVLRHHHGQRCKIGYSDHTMGITVPIAAVAMGASVIEKHLTLDRTQTGPDHRASIEPEEFRVMVNAIRTVEAAMGKWEKAPRDVELPTRKVWGLD